MNQLFLDIETLPTARADVRDYIAADCEDKVHRTLAEFVAAGGFDGKRDEPEQQGSVTTFLV